MAFFWESILETCMQELHQQHPNYSDAQLADVLNISRTTFNRIKNEQRIPMLHNLIKIIIGSGNQSLLLDAMTIFDDNLAQSLQGALEVAMKEDNKCFVEKQFEALLDDRNIFVSFLLASSGKGTTAEQLQSVLGVKGLSAIQTLIKKGYVEQSRDLYKASNDEVLIRSFDSIKHHLSTYAAYYHPQHVGQQRNYIHSLSGGLNTTGITKVADAHRRFHEEIQRIYREENYAGNTPSFSVAFCDTFTSEETDNSPLNKETL